MTVEYITTSKTTKLSHIINENITEKKEDLIIKHL